MKERLLETFDQFRDAMFRNDTAMIDRLMADEYVGFDPAGNPQDKKLSLESYQPGMVKLDKYEVQDVDVMVIGEVGIITGKGFIHGTFSGTEFDDRLRFIDIYIHREGRWQLYLSQVTPLKET